MGDDRTFRREAFHVLCFLFEEAFGDQHGEIGVDVARFFEHAIQPLLYLLPNAIACWLNDHAPLHRGVICHFGFANYIDVPLRVVIRTFGDALGHG